MELTDKGLKDSRAWTEKGYSLPRYDREAVREKSLREPVWLHFGGGNIFRAFQAAVVQELINEGSMDRGVAVVASSDPEVVQHVYREHDNLCLLVTLKADGTAEKSVIGSLMESFAMNFQDKAEKERLTEIFKSPSLQLASFTITEKGYQVKDGTGLLPAVREDIEAGPENPRSYLGKVASLLLARFRAGAAPLALVSMDNVSRNGDKLREAMLCYAKGWQEKGYVPELAESFEVSGDGCTYTFHLREGLRYANGDPIDAQDFVDTFRRMADPLTASTAIYLIQDLPPPLRRGQTDDRRGRH